MDWCDKLVETSKRTGKDYMLGETTYYRPQTMFCRRKAAEGAFGNFIYAEGEYFHDIDSGGLRGVSQRRENSKAGGEWKILKKKYIEKGIKTGPMHYPTHSTSGPVSVMKAHALKVAAYGYRHQDNDSYFAGQAYAFTNETAFFKMSNGATVRICEFREQAGSIADSETFRIIGTKGSYMERKWKEVPREIPLDENLQRPLKIIKLTDEEMRDPLLLK